MNIEQEQDLVIYNFKRDIERIFKIPVTQWGYGFDFHASTNTNHSFRNSKYFEDPTNKSYFHLTKYKNIFSIINSGTLRMYNILNSKDENELKNYGNRLSSDQMKNIKDRVHIFSCCLYNDDNINNKKLWEEYGEVAIVFEFVNEAKGWDEFHFSKTYYQENEKAFDEYFNLIEFNKNQYSQNFYFDSAIKLAGFYKIPSLSWENEMRLLFNSSPNYRTQNLYQDFKVSDYHTGITKYVDIPLFVDENNRIGISQEQLELRLKSKFKDDSVPHIKIKSLIFGDNEPLMSQETFDKIKFDIELYVMLRLGYKVEISDQLFKTGVTKKKEVNL